jgi:Flp pilus assembly protein TadD
VCCLAAYNLGNLKLQEGNYEMAVAMYDRCIVGNPLNWRAINNKGCALLKLGRMDQAESFFRKSQEVGCAWRC